MESSPESKATRTVHNISRRELLRDWAVLFAVSAMIAKPAMPAQVTT